MEYRFWGNRGEEIVDFAIMVDDASHTTRLVSGTRITVIIWTQCHRDVAFPVFGLNIKTPDGLTVFGCNSRDCANGPVVRAAKAGEKLCVTYHLDQVLGAGEYLISLGIAEEQGGEIVPLDRRYDSIHTTVTNPISRSVELAEFNMTVDVR